MKTVAIIAEYNPFHLGHQYQIDRVRDILGEDTAIVAVMSGNFTQRGEIAIADKTLRARAAVDCGVNLVLEIPFPYSMTSAENYAMSGVTIADSLGVVDYLAFGSECGDLAALREVALRTESYEYRAEISRLSDSPEHANLCHPALSSLAYRNLYGEESELLSSPNNILAIEYLRALHRLDSDIIPMTVKREGAGYNDALIDDERLQSASAIRDKLLSGDISALDYLPENAKIVYYEAIASGKLTRASALDAPVISHLRLNPPTYREYHDCAGGLNYRLADASLEANTITSLIALAQTKRYTAARVRRALLSSYFGVTSSDILTSPKFTQVLAMDPIGASILKKTKKMTDFPIITKPSAFTDFGDEVVRQKSISVRADSVFALCEEKPSSAKHPLTFTPYVKKAR